MKSCNSCGKCCTHYGGRLSATEEEIDRWETYRPDIYRYVNNGRIWADPDTGATLDACPFLYQDPAGPRKLCSIYDQRPDDCRLYPSTVSEMIRDGCEMIEKEDLRHPRRAHKNLASLMGRRA